MNKPTFVPDPDVLPDDMDFDDLVLSASIEPAQAPEKERPCPPEPDIASAQRPPADS
jgi:hypothetical protein